MHAHLASTLRSGQTGFAPPPTLSRDEVVASTRVCAHGGQRQTRLTAPVNDGDGDALVERAREGDSSAFALLFRRHRNDVARLIHRMMSGAPVAEVEDLVQEVFLQVHRSLKDFRGQSRFSTWLYRITVNVVLMHRRAKKSRPTYVEETEASSPHDSTPSPDDLAARNARVRAFYRLLEQLSEKKRQVYVLHELEGISPTEIAEIVEAPVLTVRTRLFYARKELAGLLRQEPSLASLAESFEAGRRDRAGSGRGRSRDSGSKKATNAGARKEPV